MRNMKLGTMVLALAVLVLGACGKKGSPADAAATVGFYRATSEKMIAAKADFFIVTANHDLYRLTQDQTKHSRAYAGNLANASFSFDGSKFESGDFAGTKLAGNETDIPEPLRILHDVNVSAVKLLGLLNAAGLKLELRLERTNPEFNAQQKEIIEKLVVEKETLIKYMKDGSLDEFRINDYTNTKLYTKEKHLHLPGGLGALRGDEVVDNLKNSKDIDTY